MGAEGAELKPSSAELCGCKGALCGRRSGADSAVGNGELPASSMIVIMSKEMTMAIAHHDVWTCYQGTSNVVHNGKLPANSMSMTMSNDNNCNKAP